jgi:hypothetical protein
LASVVGARKRTDLSPTALPQTVLKYVQEALKGDTGTRQHQEDALAGNADIDHGEGRVTLRLADSALDDETCHGVANLISTTDVSCKDDCTCAGERGTRPSEGPGRARDQAEDQT